MKRKTAKKIITRTINTLVVVGFIGAICFASDYAHHYKMDATVYEVKGDEVTFLSNDDNFWKVETEEHFVEGEEVELKMWDACTELQFADDEVVKISVHKEIKIK